MLSLLLTFRKGFRKPSGTFRDAGFEHVTYGLYLRDKFGDQISLLTSPTYIPHENIEFGPVGAVMKVTKKTSHPSTSRPPPTSHFTKFRVRPADLRQARAMFTQGSGGRRLPFRLASCMVLGTAVKDYKRIQKGPLGHK